MFKFLLVFGRGDDLTCDTLVTVKSAKKIRRHGRLDKYVSFFESLKMCLKFSSKLRFTCSNKIHRTHTSKWIIQKAWKMNILVLELGKIIRIVKGVCY